MPHAIVLGKFLPPHKGHEHLIRFAANVVPSLTIVVDNVEGQQIPVHTRVSWLKEKFPQFEVVGLPEPTPQTPDAHPQFWRYWAHALKSVTSKKITHLVASESYGIPLAQALECEFIPCDRARLSVHISATKFKENPTQYWDQLLSTAQPFYTKLVRIMGPESTGKSTLCAKLATHFNCLWQPEYAKDYIDQGLPVSAESMPLFMRAQNAALDSLLALNDKAPLIISDTCPLTTSVWSKSLFDLDIPPVGLRHFEKTFLIYPTADWKDDTHRHLLPYASSKSVRVKMFEDMEAMLLMYQQDFVVLKGNYEENFNTCVAEITPLLETLSYNSRVFSN